MARSVRSLALSCFVVCALLFASASARAQEAHCSWLKIKVAGKGYEVDTEGSALGVKRSVKANCYAQLVFVDPSEEHPYGRYTAPLICLVGANDNWQMTDAINGIALDLLGDGNALGDDDYLTFHSENGDVIQGYAGSVLTVSLDKKTGAFKKATWKILAGQMMDFSTYFMTPSPVFGSYTGSGSTVPAEKVPEAARAEMSSGMCP